MLRASDPDLPNTAAALRRELKARNLVRCTSYEHELSSAEIPSVLYAEDTYQNHGNFYPPAYRRILANPAWRARLNKAYTASARIPHQHSRTRRELDTATSSDALLMSIFCAPGTLRSKRLQSLLNLGPKPHLTFGHRTRIPLTGGYDDRTEADLQITTADQTLLIEAKLTETGFQTARPALLARYPAFESTFDTARLPRNGRNDFLGYQLIRNILAADHHSARFALLADSRRPDLHEQAFRIFAAVNAAGLRSRLHLITWQELAATLSKPLQHFLATKYGIAAHG
ncbi:PGN_0703 family putative restriction endonuclease [Terriglobus sp.]|uniref:PGN_0703 family putative restriction endonuclease n=1 Tax=Terriglobus sp. TaxID=1889013 RepID=UPI003B00E3C1